MSYPADAQRIIDYAVAAGVRGAANRSAGQVVSGTHASGSYHYLGQAVDFGDADSDCLAAFNAFAPLATGAGAPIVELFGCNGQGFKNGQAVNGAAFDPATVAPGSRHTHVAIARGASLDGAAGGFASADATSTGSAGALSSLGTASTALRLVEVLAGAVLILMGLVALSKTLKGNVAS